MKAVLICAHGSSENPDNDLAHTHADLIRRESNLPVYCCYHEKQEPSSKDILEIMVADGVTEVIAVPMFFAPGFLANKMIPKELGLESGQLEGEVTVNGVNVLIHITSAFGNHPMMKCVMKETLEMYHYPIKDTAIILIGHGSKDPGNSNTVEYNAAFVREMGYRVTCAYNEMQSPTVEEGLEFALKSKVSHIVAIPMFVAPGNHTVNEIPVKLGLIDDRERTINRDGVEVKLEYAREIGLNKHVGEILLERSREY